MLARKGSRGRGDGSKRLKFGEGSCSRSARMVEGRIERDEAVGGAEEV